MQDQNPELPLEFSFRKTLNEKGFQNLTIDDLPLSQNTYKALKKAKILVVEQLQKMTFGELLDIQNLRAKNVAEILNVLRNIRERLERRDSDFDKPIKIFEFVADTKLPRPEFSIRLVKALAATGITTIRDVLSLQKETLLRLKNFGRKSYVEFIKYLETQGVFLGRNYVIVKGGKAPKVEEPGLPQFFKSLEKFAEQLRLGNDKLQRDIYETRVMCKRKRTLESLGAEYGLTRERIRQIEAKVHQKVAKIMSLNLVGIEALFKKYGNIIDLKTIPEIQAFADDYFAFKDCVNAGKFDFYIDHYSDIMLRKPAKIPALEPELVKATEEEIDANLLAKISEIAGNFPKSEDAANNQQKILEKLKNSELQKHYYYFEPGNFYVRNRYLRTFKVELYEQTFKDLYPEGIRVHLELRRIFKDYAKRLPKRFLAATQRALLMKLERCPNIILTDIGFYRHIDSIEIPQKAIDFAVQACNKSAAQDPITEVYLQNKDFFDKNGVTTRQMLISFLSRRADLNANIDARQRRRGNIEDKYKDDESEI